MYDCTLIRLTTDTDHTISASITVENVACAGKGVAK